MTKIIFGTGVYSESYYEDVEKLEQESVEHIAEWIIARINPRTVIDIGCGPGHLLWRLKGYGVDCMGIDISDAAIFITQQKDIKINKVDLTKPPSNNNNRYDLAISCEVAEHLDKKYANVFLDHIISFSDIIYLTAAEPNPEIGPGLHHVNEQPNEYWINALSLRDYQLDDELTNDARNFLRKDSVVEYLQKPMVFRKRQ